MTRITSRIKNVRQRLVDAACDCGRDPAQVALLAVSKTRPVEDIQSAMEAGLTCFGENYLQEALPKIEALSGEKISWHFIGPVQSNKTRDLAAHFDWVQSVDRLKVATRLSAQRSSSATPLNVCVQVNIDAEPQKAGVLPDDAELLCQAVSKLPQLRLRGLMIIPAASDDIEKQYSSFMAARQLFDQIRANGLPLDTLSMGMSGDLEAAVRAGSSMVRIGTDIFGPRP